MEHIPELDYKKESHVCVWLGSANFVIKPAQANIHEALWVDSELHLLSNSI